MPVVPLARPASTALGSMPTPRYAGEVSPDQFGASVGRGVQDAAGVAFKIYQAEMDRQNEARVTEARNAESLASIADRKRLAEARGKDADTVFQEIAQQRQKRVSESEAKLANAAQKDAFRSWAKQEEVDFVARGTDHVMREGERYADEQQEASEGLGVERIKNDRADAARVDQVDAEITHSIQVHGQQRGQPPEKIAERIAKFRRSSVLGAAGADMDAGDTAAARTRITVAKSRGHIGDADAADILAKIDAADRDTKIRAESQRQADSLLRQGIGLDGVQDAVERISDPAVRDAVQDRLMAGIRLREQARAADAQQAWTTAYQELSKDPSKTYADLEPALLSRVRQDPELDMRLRSISAKGNRQIETDLGAYQELEIMAATRPQEFAQKNLNDYLGKLSPSDAKRFIEMQAKAKRGDPRAAGWLVDREQLVSQALAQADVDPQPVRTVAGKPKVNQEAIRFRDLVSQEALMLSGGAEPTHDQVRQAITRVQTRTVLVDRWVDKKVPVWQLAADDVPVFSDIPAGEASVIRQQIGQAGGQATDERVARAYAARLRGDAAAYTDILKER